ncbi:unnamed protein product [Discosporangium mesarthrocarpum]
MFFPATFKTRYPNTARVYLKGFTGNADMPYDFFMSRYKEV